MSYDSWLEAPYRAADAQNEAIERAAEIMLGEFRCDDGCGEETGPRATWECVDYDESRHHWEATFDVTCPCGVVTRTGAGDEADFEAMADPGW